MLKHVVVITGLIMPANAVVAQEGNPFKNSTTPAQATKPTPSNTGSTTVKISAEDCARLVAHKPRADVAYKPGVDVHGKPVTSADTDPSYAGLKAPKTVEFDIAFSPLHAALANRFAETKLSIGRVRYDINSGEMTFNGKPLSDTDKVTLGKRCREKMKQ